MGILISVISCRLIKLRCVTRLQNKKAMEVTRAIRDTVNILIDFFRYQLDPADSFYQYARLGCLYTS